MRCLALPFALALAAPALAQEMYPATLAGHALLPALTLVPAPADAPADAQVSGKFTGPARNDVVGSVMGTTGAQHGRRETGISLPFAGQPVQGLSGYAMTLAGDGTIYVLSDNGFGARNTSPDALLMYHRIAPDFATGTVGLTETVFLRDPDRVIPFRIAYEGSAERYLTGADFDPESIQVLGDAVWIGDEFGPYLIRTSLDGVVTGVFPTLVDGKEQRSPDHPALRNPSVAGTDFTVGRSSGYEGMALQPGTNLLWAMLEKPLIGADGNPEGNFLRVLAFDPATQAWTGDSFRFALPEGATAIGDFNFVDATRALVIVRDDGEGDPSLKCAGDPLPDCFPAPAMLKRVVLIDTATVDADGFVRQIGQVDLMAIADPNGVARLETAAARDMTGTFTFPFFTIEDVMAVSPTQIMVGVDNNLPSSTGRSLSAAADNEIILLDVPELLAAQ
jgi:hypothetical protein